MGQNYEVVVKQDDRIFVKLVIEYSTNSSLFSEMNSVIREVLEKDSIEEENVTNLVVTKEGKKVKIVLLYTKFNVPQLIKGKSEKEQIIAVLEQLGYSSEKIRKVELEKKWPNIDTVDDKVWKVEIDEHYYPDESLSQQSDENFISRKIGQVLGLKVSVSMY